MADGPRTTNLNRVAMSDEVIVNRANSTGLQAIQDLATQLAGSGAIASALNAIALVSAADYARVSYPALNAVTGASNGQTGIALVGADRGIYERQSGAWVRVADLPSDTGQAAAEAAAATALSHAQSADAQRLAALAAAADAFAADQATLATEARINASTALITNDRGNWTTGATYSARDVALQSGIYYLCGVAHTAGVFATDLAAGKWSIWQGITATDLSSRSQMTRGSALVGHRGETAQVALDRRQPELSLHRIKTKLATISTTGYGTASLAVFGDSIAKSLMNDDVFKSLWDLYGFRGMFVNPASAVGAPFGWSLGALTGGAASGSSAISGQWTKSPNGELFSMSAAGHRVRFRSTTGYGTPAINRATLVYVKKPGGGTFKLEIIRPGGADYPIEVAGYTSVSTDASEVSFDTIVVDFPALEAGVELSALWLSGGSVELVGALVEDTTAAGLVLSFFDRGGIDMADTNTQIPAGLSTLLGLVKPDLITWSMKDSPLSAVTSKLAAHQSLWDAAYSTSWLYIAPYPDIEAATADQARAQAQPVIDHAISTGHDYWDTVIDCPTYAYGVARGWYGDITHFNNVARDAIGPRLWRATGLLPDFRSAQRSRSIKRPMGSFDAVLLGNVDLAYSLRKLREAAIVSSERGVRFPAATNSFVVSEVPTTTPGTGSFTLMATLRVSTGTPADVQAVGLRPAQGGGNLASSVVLVFRGLGDCRLELRSTDNATAAQFSTSAAGAAFWGLPGEIVPVAVRRDTAAPSGRGKYAIFVNGVRYDLAGQASVQALVDQDITAGYLKVGAIAANISANEIEHFGAAYYRSALSDAEIAAAAIMGAFPSGADTVWTFSERSGRIVSGPNGKRGVFGGNAALLSTRTPRASMNNTSITLIPNETVIANRAGGGTMVATLPAGPVIGDFVEVHGQGASGWRITHPNGHQIVTGAGTTVGTNATTIGTNGPPVVAPGYVASTQRYDRVRLVCVLADTANSQYTWAVATSVGTLTWA